MLTLTALREEIKQLPTDELRDEFRKGLQLSVEHLTRLAVILAELESRGEKVAGVLPGFLALLRQIANGTLLAEALVRFAAAPKAMREVARLPIEEQQAVLDDEEECARRIRPKRSGTNGTGRRSAKAGEAQQNPLIAASLATVKDLAEQIADMISCHPEPEAVWAALMQEPVVRRLVSGKKSARMEMFA